MLFSHPLKLSASLILSTALTSVALADDAADGERRLDPIEVEGTYLTNEKFSGTKTLTPIINVPQSLSVVSADQIAEQGFTNVGDILRYTPGASVGQGEGHRDQITLRGQTTTADFFIDGLRDDVQYFRPLYNIEQIEILRGSNAMIFGRGGGGGIVNRVTKRPQLDESIRGVSLSADTFGELSGTLDFNTPLTETSGFRVNAFAEALNNHRNQFDGNRFAINPTYLQELTPDTDLLFSYEFVDDDRVVDRGVPSENGRPVEGFENFFFGSPSENRTTLQAHILRARLDHSFTETLSGNATIQYADYDKLYQNLYPAGIDTSAGLVTLDGYKDTTERQNLIFQANLIAEGSLGGTDHVVLVGLEYADQDTTNARKDNVFSDTQDDQTTIAITSPLDIPAFAFSDPVRNRASDVQVLSLYAQDQIDIGDHFKVIAGLRFDQFEIDVQDFIAGMPFSRTDEEVSPRLGLIYKPVDHISAYLSYSKSFLPRSGDQFLTLSASTEELSPEAFENTEIGLKWDVASDLSLTTALFQLDRDTSLATADAENRFLAITETKGFEIQLSGNLTERWTVDAGYSWLNSKIVGGSDDGRETGQVPKNMFSIWNRYNATEALSFGLGLTYQDEFFVNSGNAVTIPDYTRVDAAAIYELDNGTILQLNIENLFDEAYFPDAHSNSNISTGAPLNARISVRTKF
ncbi:MAG: TonB-dependent siderophore receptor [Ponticaulis sp.]|nr:TonB-dependent siderophore receptor [Ponticaulis sp.]|tara:strand:+ start:45127 stop:47199 length:2073 start_codon:yes stop_codon:yes gene_type:complete